MVDSKPILCGSFAGQIGGMGVAVHNAAYKALDMSFTYVSFSVDNIEESIKAIKTLGFRGMGISMPFKQSVLEYVDALEDDARKIGAVNTIVHEYGILRGYNTDCWGIRKSIENIYQPDTTTRVVILGAGGVGRAAIYAMKNYTEHITVYNRDTKKGMNVANLFNVKYGGLPQDMYAEYDILINATSVGFRKTETLLSKNQIKPRTIVMDVVFDPVETSFIKQAKSLECTTIKGWELLLNQAVCQFELYTNIKAPINVMRDALLKYMRKLN